VFLFTKSKSEKRIPQKNNKEKVFADNNGSNSNYDLPDNGIKSRDDIESQRKTITRTFRLFEELSYSLDQLVGEMNTSQTSLMNEILKQYLNWAQFIINHESPFVTFDSGTFLALIESVDDEKLEKIVKDFSNEAAVDFIKFRWKRVNFRNIVRYLELLSSYANIGKMVIGPMNGNGDNNHTMDKGGLNGGYERYEIAVRHHLGKRWSTFLGMYISNLFKTSIPETEANYEVSTKSCFVYVNMAMHEGSV
jgi:hypothetical protein